ncbi:hypothetical protein [Enterovibrio norvegicus]|uniref:Uncharacterized protein n=1 Tax=Enterovibrio norvegicus TaxID=188144 RepID=A0A2N7L8S4_9GAMM|nr:hypothetical protein [Enterovibrio norvegicus]PMN90677.1 hypothetical protein BCT23_04105 [Enterovibrio norvegicus]
MAYEYGKVEGGFRHLDARELERLVPSGLAIDTFKSQPYDGHLVLLNDAPKVPVLQAVKGNMGGASWTVNPAASTRLSPQAQKAFVGHTKMRSGGDASGNGSLHPPLPEPPYSPESVVDESTPSPTLAYEYRFEVVCSEETHATEVGCQFSLGRTSVEGEIGSCEKRPSEHGTEFIARAKSGNPRPLITKIAAPDMGVSRRKAVALNAFIPVTPAEQLGARLGFPSDGYYYHFHEHRLAQEYRLLGDGRWGFYPTRSTHEALNMERDFNKYQGAILAFWKIDGKVADNQHLVYLKSPITREQLDNLDEDWLTTHGVKLDIPSLLETKKQTAITRTTNSNSASEHFPPETPNTANHPANVWYDYNDRFLAGSTHKSINKPDSAANDLPVVKLYDDSPQRVFAKSCLVEKGCIDIGTQEEPISNFAEFSYEVL